jgi:hypothetical protein
VRGFLGGSSEGLGLDVVSSWWRRRWIFGFDIEIGGSLGGSLAAVIEII